MQLNKFQAQFKDLMLDHPDALDTPPAALAAYCEVGEIPLPARLKVYRNNIVGSLTDLMVATFPILENLVGREFLEMMARSFILENPPTQGCLSLYGAGFDGFIDGFELAKSMPYLPDVARLELAVNTAYYADDGAPMTAEALGAVPPEELADLALKPRHSVQLVRSKFPLIAIRDFCLAEVQDGTLRLDQGGVAVMVYRPALETKIVALGDDEYAMLETLLADSPLGAAVEAVINDYEAFDLQAFLQKHLALETFTTITPKL